MANILIFDKVTGKAKEYITSADTIKYLGRDDVLIDPKIPKVDLKFIKVDKGQAVEITQEEKEIVAVAEAQAVADAVAVNLTDIDDKISSVKLDDLTLKKVDAKIDAISSLAEAKVFFKLLIRYIIKYAQNNL